LALDPHPDRELCDQAEQQECPDANEYGGKGTHRDFLKSGGRSFRAWSGCHPVPAFHPWQVPVDGRVRRKVLSAGTILRAAGWPFVQQGDQQW
jgi:hypothetical protein